MRKFRRIIKNKNSKKQAYQHCLMCLLITITSLILCIILANIHNIIFELLYYPILSLVILIIIFFAIYLYFNNQRERVSVLEIPSMRKKEKRIAKKIKKLFNDKQITDVLKLSNVTRYGVEMPEIYVWIDSNCISGYIAIENIAIFDRADKEKFEQRISGILSGKFQRFSVTKSNLTLGDSFIIFYIEDTLTSHRLIISNDNIFEYIQDKKHLIMLSNDLIWDSETTPMLSIIARTRAGKSVFAGRYLAKIMLLQGWKVEYNSAKLDRYVIEHQGKSEPQKIVERAEYWCRIMDERLSEIQQANKEKYSEIGLNNIAIFFDELGNLNASMESLDKLDKTLKLSTRWTTAINRLTSTGGSAGIHIIAISQFATKEGFLPSLSRVNCSDAVIMLGGAANSAEERKYLISGYTDIPKRNYGKGQGLARIIGAGEKWEEPHYFETPWFE